MTRYSVAEAKDRLPRLLREAESGAEIEVTRRGEPIAVVLGKKRYDDLLMHRTSFSERYRAFRAEVETPEVGEDPVEIYDDIRDSSPGSDFQW